MRREIEISWPDFNISLAAELLDDENPRLTEQLWRALPFETMPMIGMNVGKIMKVPLPISMRITAEDKLSYLPDQPPGTLLGLNGVGFFLLFGIVVEPFTLPRVVKIPETELQKLIDIVPQLEDAFWLTKKVYKAIFTKRE